MTHPFVQAKSYTRANRKAGQITGIVIHTMEAGEGKATAENVASWFAGPSAPKASAHYNVDADSVVQSVREEDVAWHAGPVNDWTIGVEHAGYAKQTPEEWADPYSWALLERSADLVADLCRRYLIPVVRLTADDLKMGRRAGIFGHVDVTNGLTGGTGHYDPGPHFPWTEYLALVQKKVDEGDVAPTDPPPSADGPLRAASIIRDDGFVEVSLGSDVWLVKAAPIPFVGIGQAMELAAAQGCTLPTAALADAIWRAADLRISPAETIQAHDGVHMNTGALQSRVMDAVDAAINAAGGSPIFYAGAFKDVIVLADGSLGIYGWHVGDVAAFQARLRARGILGPTGSLPLYAPSTSIAQARVVQSPTGQHSYDWDDYSQGARVVRRKG